MIPITTQGSEVLSEQPLLGVIVVDQMTEKFYKRKRQKLNLRDTGYCFKQTEQQFGKDRHGWRSSISCHHWAVRWEVCRREVGMEPRVESGGRRGGRLSCVGSSRASPRYDVRLFSEEWAKLFTVQLEHKDNTFSLICPWCHPMIQALGRYL